MAETLRQPNGSYTDRSPEVPARAAAIEEAVAIMARLRGPGGCPWDREQTFDSIKLHTLEETYEVFDAIERRAWPDLKDELGDLLLQIIFYAQMAAEAGYFDLNDVAENLNAKLIRRHPHIFGDAKATDADAVLRNWELIKQREKSERRPASGAKATSLISLLDDIPRSMPAMLEATKLGSRAAKIGFDWPDHDGVLDKLEEETAELRAELVPAGMAQPSMPPAPTEPAEAELGDVLFTTANLARHLKLDPESALRAANAKFRRRFRAMEEAAGSLEARTPEQLADLWNAAKQETAVSAALSAGPVASATSVQVADAGSRPEVDATQPGEIRIAPLSEMAQFDRCVDIQVSTWGYADSDVIPRRMFLLAGRIGGQVIGAIHCDDLGRETIVGFAMALPGFHNQTPYLHSHMLAVLPGYRNAGLGRRLKLAQRDDALARGFNLIEWTFDPLEIKNAYLNISRLGAISRRYHPDFYGPSSSPLQGGLPTDRLYAEWWLRSPRVLKTLSGEAPSLTVVERVAIPSAVSELKQDPTTRRRALDLQTTVRESLRKGFAHELAVVGYERNAAGDGCYLLGKVQDLE